MSDIIRRYIGEYFKNPHDFVVGANNPDIVFNRNAALKQKVMEAAQQAFQKSFKNVIRLLFNKLKVKVNL